MAKISGVSVELITKFGGVSKQLVRKLGSKLTAELGFGPDYNPGPTCDQIIAYYHETLLQTAYQKFLDALEGTEIYIEFDRDNNFFYQEGQCGQNDSYAATGYYVFDFGKGEIAYFYWNGATQTLTPQEPPAAPGPTNSTSVTVSERRSSYSGNTLIPLTSGVDFEITAQRIDTILNTPDVINPQFAHNFILQGDRGSWSGTGNLSYTYKWYIDNTLVNTSGPWPQFDPKRGEMQDYTTPDTSLNLSVLGTTIKFEVVVTDDNGTTTESVLIPVTDPILNTYLSNTGISDSTTISALKYLRQEMLTPRANYGGPYEPGAFYILESLLIDYYPIAGDTRDQHKWSMKNPNYALQFEGDLVGYRPSYWEHTSAGMYSSDTSNQNNNVVSEYSANYYATSDSASIGFAFGIFSNTSNSSFFNEQNVLPVARLENIAVPGDEGFSYYPSFTESTSPFYRRAIARYQVNPFTYGTFDTWGSSDTNGLSGLIVRDGTNFSSLGNAANIYGDIITSGSVASPNGSTIHDWFITQSNQFATPAYSLQVHGNHPLNIQFIYSSKLPMYKESPFYAFGPQSFVTHLSNTIKTYNSMLGR
jgi:hypothetical protein